MHPPTYTLNTGAKIPALGLGTWNSKKDEAGKAVMYAIDEIGYGHIDGAWMYGNEVEVGKAIKQCKTPRSEIFVTTKLWGTYHTRVSEGIKESLNNLGLEYVDLYLMHWPIPLPPTKEGFPLLPNGNRHVLDEKEWSYIDTWRAMEKLVKQGKCKAIGVSNMSIPYLERLLTECEISPAVNQIECHPLLPQEELLKYCKDKGILIQAYSPLGSANSPLLKDPRMKEIADKRGVSVSQLLISWQIARGIIVLPKSVTPSRIKENFEIIQLSHDEISALSTFAEKNGGTRRFVNPPWGRNIGFADGFGETNISDGTKKK